MKKLILRTTALFLAALFIGMLAHKASADLTDPDNALYAAASMPPWSNNQGWDEEAYWGSILTGDLNGDGIDELVGCGADGLEIWGYDPATGVWSLQELLKELAHNNDGGVYSQASYYNSLVLADIDGDGAKEILGRDVNSPDLMFTYDFNSQAASQSDKWGTGPDWSQVSGWDWEKPWCYETVMAAKLTSGDAREAVVVYTTGGLQAAFYDARATDGQSWSFSEKDSETALENLNDKEPSANFYQSLQAVRLDLTGADESDIDDIIFVTHNDQNQAYVSTRSYKDGKWGHGTLDSGPYEGKDVALSLYYATLNNSQDPASESLLQYDYGDTLRVADLDGDGLKEVIFFAPEGMQTYTFDKTETTKGWVGWQQYGLYDVWPGIKDWAPLYRNSLRFVDIDNDGKEELYNLTSNSGSYFWSVEKGGLSSVTTVGRDFTQANGWDASDGYHYADAIFFPTLSADGAKSMLARGASGMRTYEYTSTKESTYGLPHLVDAATGNFVTFTGEREKAYQAVLEYFWQQVPGMKGKDLRATYTYSLDNRQWGVVNFTSLEGMTKPAGVSQAAWATVKQQIEAELAAIPQIYQLYSSYYDHLVDLAGESGDALDAAYSLVDYSGKKSDKSNFWVGLISQTCVNLGVDLVGSIPGLEELWMLKTALPFAKDLFGAGFSALFNGVDASGSDASVELAYSQLKNKLGDWYTDNLTQLNTQLLDVLTSWGKFQHAGDFIQGILQAEADSNGAWSWKQSLTDLAQSQADAYKTGVYQYLIPMEYEIWWYHDKQKIRWWLLTFLSGPPSYSYYYDSSLNQHWVLVYKHKKEALVYGKHAPKELLEEVLHGHLSDSDQEKQDLFLGQNGWNIDCYRMPE